jgi:hypothetical protein
MGNSPENLGEQNKNQATVARRLRLDNMSQLTNSNLPRLASTRK